jgi:hypothetical protein
MVGGDRSPRFLRKKTLSTIDRRRAIERPLLPRSVGMHSGTGCSVPLPPRLIVLARCRPFAAYASGFPQLELRSKMTHSLRNPATSNR